MSKGDRVNTAGESLRAEMEVSKAMRSRPMETDAHMETLTLLHTTREALEELKLKSASHEEELRQKVTKESRGRELQEKEDVRRQELSEMEDRFEKRLAEKEEQLQKQLLQQEELMKLLNQVCQQWEASTQNWAEKQKEVGEMIQENTNSWKQMEAQYKQEVQHLREDILQLQGGPGVEPKRLEPKPRPKQKQDCCWS